MTTLHSNPAINIQRHVAELKSEGFTTLSGVCRPSDIESARELILANRHLMKNTRPTPSSGHLAGFHRYPCLEPLHTMLTSLAGVDEVVREALNGSEPQTIGLSDITINRSQQWHKDLLRGEFMQYLDANSLRWDLNGTGVFKILLYLQQGSSLKIISGSHLRSRSLDDDRHSQPCEGETISTVPVEPGDVVIMDIRCSHRGADESAYIQGQWDDNLRILVSTAIGAENHPLTHAMEKGNFARMTAWMARHKQNSPINQLHTNTIAVQ
jgi:hypothetical protein